MNRGIIYITWEQTDKLKNSLQRSQKSLDKLGLEYKVFDGSDYGSKCDIFDMSPFDETIFLDVDTVVLEDPSYGFEAASKYGMALVIAPACFTPRHWPDIKSNPELSHLSDDNIQYNSGVIFFTKSKKTLALAKSWKYYSKIIAENKHCDPDSLSIKYSDQNSLSIACWETGFNPHVLPKNWNYRHFQANRNSLFGPVKIWHSYGKVPQWIKKHNKLIKNGGHNWAKPN